jgi:DNA-binding beta-propeller fold protein YncE
MDSDSITVAEAGEERALAGAESVESLAATLSQGSAPGAFDAQGRLFFADPTRHILWVRPSFSDPARIYAGAENVPGAADGSRLAARFNTPVQVTINRTTNMMYVADAGNQRVRQINLNTNQVTTLLTAAQAQAAGGANGFGVRGVAADPFGALYITDNRNFVVWRYNVNNLRLLVLAGSPGLRGLRDGIGPAARFNDPGAAELSADNRVVNLTDVRDNGAGVIRQVAQNGQVLTIGVVGSV